MYNKEITEAVAWPYRLLMKTSAFLFYTVQSRS
jgi:hypothetical protein